MSFVHAKNSRVLVNDAHLSGTINGYTLGHTRQLSDVTTVLDDGHRWVPGLLGGSMALRGLFDSAAGSVHETVSAAAGVDDGLLVTVMPDAFTIGRPAFIAVTDLEGYSVDASVSEAVTVQIDAQPDDGVDWGVSLHAHGAETATGNSASVDNAESTSGGGVASLHVTAVSGTTPSLTVKVQHSTDNSVWVDLITFTAATAASSERKTVTGTVNRYTRETHTISGTTPSFTYAVAFARR
ncbi:MAG TPA: hypothetical protein VF174_13770 [Micromonosporaceae bacterium]